MLRSILTLAAVIAFSSLVLGQTIVGSDHDFSNKNWNQTGEICVVCHTPHNADATVTDAPLWNHETTTATFTPYTSSSLDATVGQPGAGSLMCLSCHDGTVAIDNFGGNTNGNQFITGNKLIGTDLTDDHPVSFLYDAALATLDGDLFDPTTTNSGLGGTIDEDLLVGSKVQCGSCHGVHNESGVSKLLRKSNDASALCLTCHAK